MNRNRLRERFNPRVRRKGAGAKTGRRAKQSIRRLPGVTVSLTATGISQTGAFDGVSSIVCQFMGRKILGKEPRKRELMFPCSLIMLERSGVVLILGVL